MSPEAHKIGRVCYYARQQCQVAEGCPTIGVASMGDLPSELTFRALKCERRGVQLYPDEMETGCLNHNAHRPALREKLREHRAMATTRDATGRLIHNENDARMVERVASVERDVSE